MYDPRRTRTDMPLNIGALPDDVNQMRMRREFEGSKELPLSMRSLPDDAEMQKRRMQERQSGRNLPLNMRSMPDDNYVGDGDPMDDSLRGEGPYFDAIENVMSFGVPEEFAIEVAKLTPSVELLEGGVEEQREIALDVYDRILNGMELREE
tara:strand:- start:521 stop:973 length:453 start_codon:yes stop_codon:yes gene_type:complete